MEMSINEIVQLAAAFGQQQPQTQYPGLMNMVGKKCIVRTHSAGVWFGVVAKKAGNEVIVENARQLWRWKAAESIALSGVAIHGVDASECKFPPPVPSVWLEAIELIPASYVAIESIEGCPHAVAR